MAGDIPREWLRYDGNGRIPKTISAADLMAAELPPVRWIVPGVLPEGVTLLADKPKLGKSWLALGLCVAVAAGGVTLGTRRVERGEVLYLALEDNRRRLQKRLGKMLEGPAPDGLEMATAWPKLDEGGVEALSAWLGEKPEARLVAVDTLAKIRRRARGQNVYQEDYAALEELLPLAAEHGVAMVVVHHTRKMAAADPLAVSMAAWFRQWWNRHMAEQLHNGSNGHVEQISPEEGRELFERQAQRYLKMTGLEFLEAWDAKQFGDPDDSPEVMRVAMLIPLVR